MRRWCAFVFSGGLLAAAATPLQAQALADAPGYSSSTSTVVEGASGEGSGAGQAEPSTLLERGRYGVDIHVGTSGIGFDVAKPMGRHLALRVGADFVRYRGTFEDEGANIDAFLQFGYGKAQLDFYPSGGNGRFHISPALIFANNTRIQANVVVDPSQPIDFGGDQYASSPADPLHGVGRVELRHTAPGLTLGWGNITRGKGHFTVPVDFGFFYVAQPRLTVLFSGTACDVTHPENGCGDITQDPDFQKDLADFIARNNHNLSYAQFIPIVNVGVGYRF